MFPDVIAVRYLDDYRVELKFADNVTGVIDFSSWIVGQGGVFAPLEDKEYFAKVSVNSEIGTIVWPNGGDVDPEVLYSRVTGKSIPGRSRRRAVRIKVEQCGMAISNRSLRTAKCERSTRARPDRSPGGAAGDLPASHAADAPGGLRAPALRPHRRGGTIHDRGVE